MIARRSLLGGALAAVVILTTTSCVYLIWPLPSPMDPADAPFSSPYETDEEFDAFLWMTLNEGDLWVRANTCNENQLVTEFTLGSEQTAPLRTWPITPDNDASVRLGSFDEIEQLVRDGATELSISGVAGAILSLNLSDQKLDQLTETATPDDNTVLVATASGTVLVTDTFFLAEQVLREICPPVDLDESD